MKSCHNCHYIKYSQEYIHDGKHYHKNGPEWYTCHNINSEYIMLHRKETDCCPLWETSNKVLRFIQYIKRCILPE